MGCASQHKGGTFGLVEIHDYFIELLQSEPPGGNFGITGALHGNTEASQNPAKSFRGVIVLGNQQRLKSHTTITPNPTRLGPTRSNSTRLGRRLLSASLPCGSLGHHDIRLMK